jgi:hypothetical protein
MKRKQILLLVSLAMVFATPAFCAEENLSKKPETPKAAEDLSKKLEALNADIKERPDEPMLYYRKAQCLMAMGQHAEGYKTAKQAMGLFIKKRNRLAWMLLEPIDLGNVRVDVHFNMGPRERKPPTNGIVKPLSFRVWAKGKEPRLLEIFDFEIGMMNGKPVTAALGQTTARGHGNFGLLDVDAKYETIRKKAVELVKTRHPNPAK